MVGSLGIHHLDEWHVEKKHIQSNKKVDLQGATQLVRVWNFLVKLHVGAFGYKGANLQVIKIIIKRSKESLFYISILLTTITTQ